MEYYQAGCWSRVEFHGSVLDPLLFLIFINDLDLGLLSSILKFADDTKIYGKAATPADRLQLQLDLDGQMSGG